MFSFLFHFLGLLVFTLSVEDERFFGDLLIGECGICLNLRKAEKCETEFAELLCQETCGYSKRDEKRTVIDVRYKGCYRDGLESDFEKMIPIKRNELGVLSCAGECQSRGYAYAAIQDAKFCMCSRQHKRAYGLAEDQNDCLTRCPAAESEEEKCGGLWRNAVYEISSQELQRGGVRLNEVADTLERLLPRKQEPEPMAQQTPERLTNQFNRLRMRYGKYY